VKTEVADIWWTGRATGKESRRWRSSPDSVGSVDLVDFIVLALMAVLKRDSKVLT